MSLRLSLKICISNRWYQIFAFLISAYFSCDSSFSSKRMKKVQTIRLTHMFWHCYTQRNAPTKHWEFSEKPHIRKIRDFWNKIAERNLFFYFQWSVFFILLKNVNRLYILFLVDKSIDVNNEQVLRIIENLLLNKSEFKDVY